MRFRLLLVLVVATSGCGSIEYGSSLEPTTAYGVSPAPTEARASISISVFYEELAQYGDWITYPQVGRVFVPFDPEYRPYRNGHWVGNGDELVWVSYDAIGWAVCHYGQWTVLEDGRWAWVPGTQWAPAWVDWRESERYVGWAPTMTGVVTQPQAAWVFVQTTYLLVDYVSSVFLSDYELSSAYAAGAPMRYAPDRRWLGQHRVRRSRRARTGVRRGRPARGRSARGGMRVRDPVRRARAGSVTTRGRGRGTVRRAVAGSVTSRGPARAPLVEERRWVPRETVVIGDGRAIRGPVLGHPVRPPISDAPPPLLRSHQPTPRPAPHTITSQPPPPQIAPPPRQAQRFAAPEPPPRMVQPAPRPPPRRVVMSQPPPRMVQPPPRVVQPPPRRVVMPPPRAAPPPQRRIAQPAPRRAQPPARQTRQPAQRRTQAQPQRRRSTTTRAPARAVAPGAARGVGGRGVSIRRR